MELLVPFLLLAVATVGLGELSHRSEPSGSLALTGREHNAVTFGAPPILDIGTFYILGQANASLVGGGSDPNAPRQCNASKVCADKSCCNSDGMCGFSDYHCKNYNGVTCISHCDATADCGRNSKDGAQKCGLDICCSYYGWCGTGSPACSNKDDQGHDIPCQQGFGKCGNVSTPSCSSTHRSASKGRRVGYYQAAQLRTRSCERIPPESINTTGLTHVNLAFAAFDTKTFGMSPMDPSDEDIYRRFAALKSSSLQTWISVGGYDFSTSGSTRSAFSNMAKSPESRAAFVASAVVFMERYGFQGLDIHWDFAGTIELGGDEENDTKNQIELFVALRKAFGTKYGLTSVLPASYWYLRHIDPKALEYQVDWFNFMSYDLHGDWDSGIDIYGSKTRSHTDLQDINADLLPLWYNEVDPNKVNLGLAYYGRGYTISDKNCRQHECDFTGPSKKSACTNTDGIISNYELRQKLASPGFVHSEQFSKEGAYKIANWDDQWIGYDDEETFAMKLQYADEHCLGGSTIWSLDYDSGGGSSNNNGLPGNSAESSSEEPSEVPVRSSTLFAASNSVGVPFGISTAGASSIGFSGTPSQSIGTSASSLAPGSQLTVTTAFPSASLYSSIDSSMSASTQDGSAGLSTYEHTGSSLGWSASPSGSLSNALTSSNVSSSQGLRNPTTDNLSNGFTTTTMPQLASTPSGILSLPTNSPTGSANSTGEYHVDPSIWWNPDPVLQCIPPCRLVLPPYVLETMTTISWPALVTTLASVTGGETVTVSTVTTSLQNNTITTFSTSLVTVSCGIINTITTTLFLPPFTTNEIEFWPITVRGGQSDNTTFEPVPRVFPPSTTLSLPPGVNTFRPTPYPGPEDISSLFSTSCISLFGLLWPTTTHPVAIQPMPTYGIVLPMGARPRCTETWCLPPPSSDKSTYWYPSTVRTISSPPPPTATIPGHGDGDNKKKPGRKHCNLFGCFNLSLHTGDLPGPGICGVFSCEQGCDTTGCGGSGGLPDPVKNKPKPKCPLKDCAPGCDSTMCGPDPPPGPLCPNPPCKPNPTNPPPPQNNPDECDDKDKRTVTNYWVSCTQMDFSSSTCKTTSSRTVTGCQVLATTTTTTANPACTKAPLNLDDDDGDDKGPSLTVLPSNATASSSPTRTWSPSNPATGTAPEFTEAGSTASSSSVAPSSSATSSSSVVPSSSPTSSRVFRTLPTSASDRKWSIRVHQQMQGEWSAIFWDLYDLYSERISSGQGSPIYTNVLSESRNLYHNITIDVSNPLNKEHTFVAFVYQKEFKQTNTDACYHMPVICPPCHHAWWIGSSRAETPPPSKCGHKIDLGCEAADKVGWKPWDAGFERWFNCWFVEA